MQSMTPEEIHAFLTQGARTGKIATVRPDGRPHLTPVWFIADGDDIVFTVWHTTVKAANLRRDPRVSFCVDDDRPPYAFVIIDGTASLDEAAVDLLSWTTRIAEKYMGQELGESYGRRNAVPGEFLVRVTPTHIIAQRGIAD